MYQQKCDFRASNVFSFFSFIIICQKLSWNAFSFPSNALNFCFIMQASPLQVITHIFSSVCLYFRSNCFMLLAKNRKSTKRGEIGFIFHFPSFSLEELTHLPMHHQIKMLTQSLKSSLEPPSSALNETEFAAQEVVLLNE